MLTFQLASVTADDEQVAGDGGNAIDADKQLRPVWQWNNVKALQGYCAQGAGTSAH